MAYLKPQSPIKKGDDHIYPLTTYDQIILANGTRWNGIVDDSTAVGSVNGKTGAVTLTASDIGAVDNTITINNKRLTTNITLTAEDVGALETAPVTSVNSKTGAVSLSASDVGAVPNTLTVNGKQLNSNITLTASDVGAMSSSYTAPVTSVNGKTGTVTISEIKYADVSFTFDGETLNCYGNLPTGLTDVNQIINILSFTNHVYITGPSISNNKLWIIANSVDIEGEGTTLYPYYLGYYTGTFTARVFYV